MDHDIEKAKNLKLILSTFEQLSGLKINFINLNFSALEKLKKMPLNMQRYSDARKVIIYPIFGYSDTLLEAHKCGMETHRGTP